VDLFSVHFLPSAAVGMFIFQQDNSLSFALFYWSFGRVGFWFCSRVIPYLIPFAQHGIFWGAE